MDRCTELEVGVATLWEGHHLMQYVWSYLEVGVIQQLLLPEGAKQAEGRKEKLNSYEYAAEELFSCQAEAFTTHDVVGLFYHNDSLSFYHNGVLQYTFTNIFGDGPPTGLGPAADVRPTSAARRGRRARAGAELEPSPTPTTPPLAHLEYLGEGLRQVPAGQLYPAVSLNQRLDGVTFSFEPPLWTEATHRFFPNAFTPVVLAVLFALEKRRGFSRAVATAILQQVGAGFNKIRLPCWEEGDE